MSFARYLLDQAGIIALFACGIASATFVLYVAGVETGTIVFALSLVCAFGVLAFVLRYLRRRGFYRSVDEAVEALDKKTLAAELVTRPGFADGQLLFEALNAGMRSMNDQMSEMRQQAHDYRDYVETWVHEVKTPIAAAHLVALNHPSPEAVSMDAEVARIEEYADQALYYARSMSVERDYSVREVQLGDLVRNAVRAKSRVLLDAGVAPEFGELDHAVYTDPKWMEFVIGQVIVNAAKYRKPDGARCFVRFEANVVDDGLDRARVSLTVHDNGIGIPAQDVPRVFDKGFTGDNGRAYAKSTGIGLYLCKRLCDKMHHGIELRSQQGQGTWVSIDFPLNRTLLVEDGQTGRVLA